MHIVYKNIQNSQSKMLIIILKGRNKFLSRSHFFSKADKSVNLHQHSQSSYCNRPYYVPLQLTIY